MHYRTAILFAVLGASLLSGCALNPRVVQSWHWDLNETIRQTNNEQLLLNLVRLRHDETPYFLQVSSISTQFSMQSRAGASGTFPQDTGNTFAVDTGISYTESPVVTWSLPDTRDFLGRLYAPVGTDQLTVLIQSGMDLVQVFRIGTRRMNRLRSLEYEARDGIFEPESYEEFVEALELLEELRKEGLVDLAYSIMSNYGGTKFPLEMLDPRAMVDGLAHGLYFVTREEAPDVLEPRRFSQPLFLRFSKTSDTDSRVIRMRDLLNLDETRYSFPITDTASVSPEALRSESGKLSQVYDPDAKFTHIMLNNRSVIEILRLAATYVEAPEEDVARGYVRVREIRDNEWMTVHTSRRRSPNAWLNVEHNGYWYYIAADDLRSRNTFMLLNQLFASVIGTVPGGKPVLTLPVR